MSSGAPVSSNPPPAAPPAGNKPGNVSYTNNPMVKPAAEAKPAGPGMFDWIFPKPKQPLSSTAPAAGGRRRRGGKKTHRKTRARKTRRRH